MRSIKYIGAQRTKKSCGPIALANAVKWSGIDTSYVKMRDWCRAVEVYDPAVGMWPHQMVEALRHLGLQFRVRRFTRLGQIDEALETGALIFVHVTEAKESHAVFIDQRRRTQYRVWNHRNGAGGPWCRRSELIDGLMRSMLLYGFAYAYVLKRQ